MLLQVIAISHFAWNLTIEKDILCYNNRMDAPLETTSYMIAGFIVIFGILSGYTISLVVRMRRVRKKLDVKDVRHKDPE